MQFPEVTKWLNGLQALISLIGGGFFLAALGIVGLIFMTTFGRQRQAELARAAFVTAVVGLVLVVGAPTFQTIINRIVGIGK